MEPVSSLAELVCRHPASRIAQAGVLGPVGLRFVRGKACDITGVVLSEHTDLRHGPTTAS